MVGMRFAADWQQIFTSLEFPTRSSKESCGTPTWPSRKAATSGLRTPTLWQRCSNLSDLSNMHLIRTSWVPKDGG
jgi:hypothetical protein